MSTAMGGSSATTARGSDPSGMCVLVEIFCRLIRDCYPYFLRV